MKRRPGVTLIEVVVAALILAMAMIPLGGMITRDSTVAVELGMHGFAQEKARAILNASLDEMPFDLLLTGSPGKLAGSDPAAASFAARLFPNGAKSGSDFLCDGYFTDQRGHRFQATLEIRNTTGQTFTAFALPADVPGRFLKTAPAPNMMTRAQTTEAGDTPSFFNDLDPAACAVTSIYQDAQWAKTLISKTGSDFSAAANPVFLKTLILRIRWSYIDRTNPMSTRRPAILWLVTHKARLQTP